MKKAWIALGILAASVLGMPRVASATITNTATRTVTAYGDGSTTVFTIGFPFQADADIQVWDVNTGITPGVTQIPFGTGAGKFQILGGDPGVSVVMGTAPSTSDYLIILRVTPRTQTVVYDEDQAFPAANHEAQMDKAMEAIQEIDFNMSQKVGLAVTSIASVPVFPDPVDNTFIGYDGSGDLAAIPFATVISDLGVLKASNNLSDVSSVSSARSNLGLGTAAILNSSDAVWNASELQGNLVSDTAPTTNQYLQWNGSAWIPANGSGGMNQLTGDVTATGAGSVATTVVSVGGSSAANIHASQLLTATATDADTVSTLMKRDASGNVSAGVISCSKVNASASFQIGGVDVFKISTIGNVYVGDGAGTGANTTNANTSVGSSAGSNIGNSGGFATNFGYQAGQNSSGSNVTFIGAQAGINASGVSSVGVGTQACSVAGGGSTCLGYLAGLTTTGLFNTLIGYAADVSSPSFTNTTVIGANAVGTASNQIVMGSSVTDVLFSSAQLHGVSDPTSAQDAATKHYVDNALGISFTAPTVQRLTSTGSITAYHISIAAGGATVGAGCVYTNNGHTFTAISAITAPTVDLYVTGTGTPSSTGTLTYSSGGSGCSGAANITFAAELPLATYTKPTSPAPLYLKARMIGGGAGGAGSSGGASGLDGGNSTLSNGVGPAFLIANGGTAQSASISDPGVGGTVTVSSPAIKIAAASGGGGSSSFSGGGGGNGGSTPFAGGGAGGTGATGVNAGTAAGANTGAGGGGAANNGAGGGAGGYIEAIITSPASTYFYTVGTGGTGGTGSNAGGAGGSGVIIVEEFYQ